MKRRKNMAPWNMQGLSPEAHRRKKEMIGKHYGWQGKGYIRDNIIPVYLPTEGLNKIRIVQPIEFDQMEDYSLEVAIHRDVGFQNDMLLCLKEMGIGPCYICEQRTRELWNEDQDLWKSYGTDKRVIMLVLDLNAQDPYQVRYWPCAYTLADEIVNQSQAPDTDVYVDPSHPTKGPVVYFTRTGQRLQTRYSGIKLGAQPYPLNEAIENQRVRFKELLIIPTYEEGKAMFLNQGVEGSIPAETPPISSYQQDVNQYQQAEADPPPPGTMSSPVMPPVEVEEEYDAPPPPGQPELATNPLVNLNRDALKQFKAAHKSTIEGLTFTIFKNMTDDELRDTMLNKITEAQYFVTEELDLLPLADYQQYVASKKPAPPATGPGAVLGAALGGDSVPPPPGSTTEPGLTAQPQRRDKAEMSKFIKEQLK
jgi:hypothetical protein